MFTVQPLKMTSNNGADDGKPKSNHPVYEGFCDFIKKKSNTQATCIFCDAQIVGTRQRFVDHLVGAPPTTQRSQVKRCQFTKCAGDAALLVLKNQVISRVLAHENRQAVTTPPTVSVTATSTVPASLVADNGAGPSAAPQVAPIFNPSQQKQKQLRQTSVKNAVNEALREESHLRLVQWIAESGVSFNAVQHTAFQQFINAVAAVPQGCFQVPGRTKFTSMLPKV